MDYWVFEDNKRVCIHRGDCGTCKSGRGLLGSTEGRVWHGAYRSYGEALTKAKQIGKGIPRLHYAPVGGDELNAR